MFRPLWKGVRRLRLSRRIHQAAPSVVGREEFERSLARERARCDRNRGVFAVLGVHPQRLDKEAELDIVEALDARMRPYDMVSILHPGEIAALLPETPAAGARSLAESIHEILAGQGIECEVTIYNYPDDGVLDMFTAADDEEGVPSALAETQDMRRDHPRIKTADLAHHFHLPHGFFRRAIDILVSGAALLALSPLLLLTALAVKLTSKGGIIYTQQRAGQGGKPFTFYKFRSMHIDADKRLAELQAENEHEGPIFKMKNDPRLTPIGRFLRRMSIDELPQLWNVFKGDMTLIGPRPPKVEEVAEYEPWQLRRLSAKGGLTCIWQVSGRSEIGFTDWMRMDLSYIDRRSLRLDLGLLSKTLWAVASGRGAY